MAAGDGSGGCIHVGSLPGLGFLPRGAESGVFGEEFEAAAQLVFLCEEGMEALAADAVARSDCLWYR